jgi:hypothetical protein
MTNKTSDEYCKEEATPRFEAALKSAMNTPHQPLKAIDIPSSRPG